MKEQDEERGEEHRSSLAASCYIVGMLQRCTSCGTFRLPALACPMCTVAPPLVAVVLTGCPSIMTDGALPAYAVMETGIMDSGVDADGVECRVQPSLLPGDVVVTAQAVLVVLRPVEPVVEQRPDRVGGHRVAELGQRVAPGQATPSRRHLGKAQLEGSDIGGRAQLALEPEPDAA